MTTEMNKKIEDYMKTLKVKLGDFVLIKAEGKSLTFLSHGKDQASCVQKVEGLPRMNLTQFDYVYYFRDKRNVNPEIFLVQADNHNHCALLHDLMDMGSIRK